MKRNDYNTNKQDIENRLLKVLFVHDGPLYTDGKNFYSTQFTNDLVNRYKELGDHVTFLMRSTSINEHQKNKFLQITEDNFKFISIPNFKSLFNYYKKWEATKVIKDAVIEHDIIICRLPSASGTIAAKTAKKFQKPLMVEFVACTYDAYWNYGLKGKLIAHYKLWKQRSLVKNVPFIIYVTENFLQERYPSNGIQTNISNVKLPELNERILKKRIDKIETTNFNEPLTLGTIATLNAPFKAQSDVIKAIAKLKKQGILFNYKLVGQGNPSKLQAAIKKYKVEDLVTIVGPLPHDDVLHFLDSLDIYIHPSKQEGLPRAIIEAMSRACPALGAGTAGIPELLPPTYIFNKGSVNQIKEKLQNINKNDMINMAIENFKRAHDYQSDILNKRRTKFYLNFLTANNIL